jgi:hypothetical protein
VGQTNYPFTSATYWHGAWSIEQDMQLEGYEELLALAIARFNRLEQLLIE